MFTITAGSLTKIRALPAVVRGRKILACSRLSVAGDEHTKKASERKKRKD